MIRFVSIVTHAENLELRKDPGQVPYQLHRLAGYDAVLVSYYYTLDGGRNAGPLRHAPADDTAIAQDYPFLHTEVPGLKMHFLENRGRGRFYERAVLDYLRQHSVDIDILNLFHFSVDSIVYALYYKLKNPRGKIYLKLDIDLGYYLSRKAFIHLGGQFSLLKSFVFTKVVLPFFFRKTHLISAESAAGAEYFKKRFNVPGNKVKVLPNGVDAAKVMEHAGRIYQFSEKKNLLLTVGRIGSPQKNNETLLEAIPLIGEAGENWSFCFAGPIAPDFRQVINEFFLNYPHLEGRVIFTGEIRSPGELYRYYNQAKLFCLTSRSEGFPVSAAEAAFFGNHLLLSDAIACFDELTAGGSCGSLIANDDAAVLAAQLRSIMADEKTLLASYENMRDHAQRNLTWEAIIPQLDNYLSHAIF